MVLDVWNDYLKYNWLQFFVAFWRDIMSIYNEPPPGMCIVPDKEDITKVQSICQRVPQFGIGKQEKH